jgi:hypothetical protein
MHNTKEPGRSKPLFLDAWAKAKMETAKVIKAMGLNFCSEYKGVSSTLRLASLGLIIASLTRVKSNSQLKNENSKKHTRMMIRWYNTELKYTWDTYTYTVHMKYYTH